MFSKLNGYNIVKTDSSEDAEQSTSIDQESVHTFFYQQRTSRWSKTWPWVSFGTNALLLVALIWQYLHLQSPLPPYPDLVYSPAQHVISYKKVTFVDGVQEDLKYENSSSPDRPIYLGPPTNATDAAWAKLYSIGGISQIPNSQAARLAEPTAPVLDEPGVSFVGLDVFHQLHCLNWVRMALRPERYNSINIEKETEKQRRERYIHIDHCIDSIRQSLMCSADISPVIWHWKRDGGLVQNMNNTHVCRDFGAIEEWARKHMLMREINSRLEKEDVWEVLAEASR